MTPFLIFLPLFGALLGIVYLMDWTLRPRERYGWEPEPPRFLVPYHDPGFSSHMRAIQVNPLAVARKRNRPSIARQFPVVSRMAPIPCGAAHIGCPKGSGLCSRYYNHLGSHLCDTCGRSF